MNSLSQNINKDIQEFLFSYRFCDKIIKSCLDAFIFNLVGVMRSACNVLGIKFWDCFEEINFAFIDVLLNDNSLFEDFFESEKSVHDRHFQVNKNNMKLLFLVFNENLDCFFSGASSHEFYLVLGDLCNASFKSLHIE